MSADSSLTRLSHDRHLPSVDASAKESRDWAVYSNKLACLTHETPIASHSTSSPDRSHDMPLCVLLSILAAVLLLAGCTDPNVTAHGDLDAARQCLTHGYTDVARESSSSHYRCSHGTDGDERAVDAQGFLDGTVKLP